MRSPVVNRIIKQMKNDPWYVKLKRWIVVEIHCIKCLGVRKYIKGLF
jgi:hypothetical protein